MKVVKNKQYFKRYQVCESSQADWSREVPFSLCWTPMVMGCVRCR